MKEKKSPLESLMNGLLAIAKVVVVLLLVYIYLEAWINAWKDKNYLRFALLSILPAMCLYCLGEEMVKRSEPNINDMMFDAQIKAWERENDKNR